MNPKICITSLFCVTLPNASPSTSRWNLQWACSRCVHVGLVNFLLFVFFLRPNANVFFLVELGFILYNHFPAAYSQDLIPPADYRALKFQSRNIRTAAAISNKKHTISSPKEPPAMNKPLLLLRISPAHTAKAIIRQKAARKWCELD